MWQAIRYVTGVLSLIAFISAVIGMIKVAEIKQKEKLIKYAPDKDRKSLIQDILELFHVDLSNLTKQQQYEFAIEQIRAKARRFLIGSAAFVVISLLLFIIYSMQDTAAIENYSKSLMTKYINAIARLETGMTREKALELFGSPTFSENYQAVSLKEDIYSESFGIIRLTYDVENDGLRSYCITKLSELFNPVNKTINFLENEKGEIARGTFEELNINCNNCCEILVPAANSHTDVRQYQYFEKFIVGAGYYGDVIFIGFYNLPGIHDLMSGPVPAFKDELLDSDPKELPDLIDKRKTPLDSSTVLDCDQYKMPRFFRQNYTPNTICIAKSSKAREYCILWPSKRKFFPWPYKPG